MFIIRVRIFFCKNRILKEKEKKVVKNKMMKVEVAMENKVLDLDKCWL